MERETTCGIRVPFQQTEQIRRYLSTNNLLRTDLKIKKTKKFIYLPVIPPKNTSSIQGFKLIRTGFERCPKIPTVYKELLSLPDGLNQVLPTSYDIIGDILLIKLPKKLSPYKNEIGEALLKSHTHIKVVCTVEPVKGELRTRTVQIIAGEHRTTTTHVEYGLQFDLDVQTTYFSSRLATERKRITTLVQPGEIVVDMFAGVAPFSIMIAKYAHPKIVYAVDKNKDAVFFARQNCKRNRVLDTIEVLHLDAKDIPTLFYEKNIRATRIIMNLPFSSFLFFPTALQCASDHCVIHYYDILKEEQIKERIHGLKQKAKEYQIDVVDVQILKIKTYAPREFYIGLDITAQKKREMPL